MKRVLHIFATKLISKDIQKCNCFLVPSNDLFASARKCGISRANSDRRLQIEKHVIVSAFSTGHKNVKQTFLNQSWDPPRPNKKFLHPPLVSQ